MLFLKKAQRFIQEIIMMTINKHRKEWIKGMRATVQKQETSLWGSKTEKIKKKGVKSGRQWVRGRLISEEPRQQTRDTA